MQADTPELVPPWLVRSGAIGWRVLAAALMVIVLGLVAYTIPLSTTATLVSLVVACALTPTALRLRARGMSRQVSAAITFGGGAILIVGTAVLVLFVLIPDLRAVIAAVDQGLEDVRDQLAALGAPEAVSSIVDRLAGSVRASVRPDLGEVVGTAASVGTVLVLGTFLTYFLLADGDRGWAWLMRSAMPGQVGAITASARDGMFRVAWYVRRTAVLAAVDGLTVGIVLSVMGVPLAGALGAIAFAAGFVPYLGAIAGGTTVALAALALGGPLPAALVLVALVLAWIVATRLLEGTAMSRRVDVHPVIVLVAIPAGLALFGFLGLIALLPVTVFGLAVARSVIVALDLGPGGGAVGGGAEDAAVAVARPDLPVGVPVWLDRLAQWSWRGLVLAGLGWLGIGVIVRVPSVVVPAVIAVVAAATLLPLVDRLAARGWSRGLASAVSTVGTTTLVALICLLAIGMTLGPLGAVFDVAVSGAASLDLTWLRDLLLQVGSELEVDVAALFASMVGLALALLLALLMTFFFLRGGRTWWRGAMDRLPATRRAPIAEAGSRAVDVLAGYMLGTAVISAFGGITSGLIMVILGLPLALPIAVLGFFAGFIPYVGSFLSTAMAFLVAVALGTTSDIVLMGIFTVVFNIAQGNFVTPLVYGKSLSLHPAVVLMAIPVGQEVAGILGMFLVVPAAAMVAATWRLVLAAIDESGLPPAAGDPALPEGAAVPGGADVPAGAAVPESRDQLEPGADHTLPAGT